MEIQVDIEAKPSHYQLVSGSSTEDSLHVHAQMVENEEEGGSSGGNNEEDPPCKHQSCEQKDCLANKAWDISLAQPESIRSDLESSDTQSDDVPDITSDECGSPHPQAAACPSTPRAPGAPSPSAHRNLSAPAEGKTVLKLEDAEARVWSGMNAPVLRSTLVTASFDVFGGGGGRAGIYVFYFRDSLVIGFPQENSKEFAISYQIKHGNFALVPLPHPPTLF